MNPITFVYNIIHAQHHAKQLDEILEHASALADENAALRQQVNHRGPDGKFAPKAGK